MHSGRDENEPGLCQPIRLPCDHVFGFTCLRAMAGRDFRTCSSRATWLDITSGFVHRCLCRVAGTVFVQECISRRIGTRLVRSRFPPGYFGPSPSTRRRTTTGFIRAQAGQPETDHLGGYISSGAILQVELYPCIRWLAVCLLDVDISAGGLKDWVFATTFHKAVICGTHVRRCHIQTTLSSALVRPCRMKALDFVLDLFFWLDGYRDVPGF